MEHNDFPKFNGHDDFTFWKAKVTDKLMLEGLDHCLTNEIVQKEGDDCPMDKNKQALAFVRGFLSDELYREYKDYTSPKELWKELCDKFGKSDAQSVSVSNKPASKVPKNKKKNLPESSSPLSKAMSSLSLANDIPISPNTLKYACSHCSEKFEEITNLDNHVKKKLCIDSLHFNIKNYNRCDIYVRYKCGICLNKKPQVNKEAYVDIKGLRKHQTDHHKDHKEPNDKMFACGYCYKEFSNSMDLEEDLNTHEKDYKCGICSLRYHKLSFLKDHIEKDHIANTTE